MLLNLMNQIKNFDISTQKIKFYYLEIDFRLDI